MEKLVEELSNNFDYDFHQSDKNSYIINITEDLQVTLTKVDNEIYFYSQIIKCPEERKDQIYSHIMKANLLGEGTGRTIIGMDKDEKFLTLSYFMSYEDKYAVFKETIEDFVNYLIYWEDEIKKLKQQEKLL